MCIASNKTFQDPKRLRHDTDGLFITSADEMSAALPAVPRGRRQHRCASPSGATSSCRWGRPTCPASPLPEGSSEDEYIGKLALEGLDARFREIAGRYPHDRDAYRQRLEMELGVIRKMGLQRLLPHRPGLHQLGQAAQGAGGPGARLGRRVHRGLVAAHHRPRPHPLEPPLRALPQSRARLDARLRRRLLPEPARRGHRLRRGRSTGRTTSGRSSPSARSRPGR